MARSATRSAKRRVPARRPQKEKKSSEREVNIFISYDSDDRKIATALYEELTDINRERIKCFLDSENIETGQGWLKILEEKLRAADWLICIYTGKESNYCGFEVGIFTASRLMSSPGNPDDSRLVCLHDVPKMPGLFHDHQNRFVTLPPPETSSELEQEKFYARSAVAKFFENLCKYKGLYVAQDTSEAQRLSQTIARKAKRITDAFWDAHGSDLRSDTPTQLSIDISVLWPPDKSLTEIPQTAQVKGTYASLNLFGIMPPRQAEQLPATSWSRIRAAHASEASGNALWIERVERDMLCAAAGDTPAEPEAIFLSSAGQTPYRAILVRHQLNWHGTHLFTLVFVPTLPRHFLGDQRTSLILAGMVVASRFRFTYLEQPSRIASKFADDVSDAEFDGNYRQFLHDLERLKIESNELGLVDEAAFIHSFGDRRKGSAQSFLTVWKEARGQLDASLPAPTALVSNANRIRIKEAISTFLERMAPENTRFLRTALEAYKDELEVELRTPLVAR